VHKVARVYVEVCTCVLIAGLAMSTAYVVAERSTIASVSDIAAQRLEVYRGGLIGEMRRYDYLSSILGLNNDLVGLLKTGDARATDKVNAYLEVVARESKALDLYVMDLSGRTVAASNYKRRDSFVGTNFSFRPYFKDALINGNGHYYGVGTVSNEPGYYFASRVFDGERLVGVATVKVSLHSLDNSLQDADEIALAADANGIIFLSSLQQMLFKTLEPLAPGTLAQLTASRQYHTLKTFDAIGQLDRAHAFDPPNTLRFRPDASFHRSGASPLSIDYLMLDRPVPGTDWRLVTLTSLNPARAAARNAAATTGLGAIAVFLFGLYLKQRRRTHAHRLKAKLELERAYDDLERQVEARTEALREANLHLQHEVAERKKTEVALKKTFEELVHSGKMAALGQMATSITHELNQPLAALQTLSDNAAVLLRRARVDDAVENLAEISQLVSRMGKITGELKSFARKAPARPVVTDLRQVVQDTVSLLRARLQHEGVTTRTDYPDRPLAGLADANRLEQVLVNLVNNAIDAMRPSGRRVLSISIRRVDEIARIAVCDTGGGLNDNALDHLFEPFFTTKAAGQGLGLGLPISAEIVKEFGGVLKGHNTSDGAEFVIDLPIAEEMHEHV
jgi:two-component system, NtrC family, C4-dicarboxylate transport sensor histidine kinase DctB